MATGTTPRHCFAVLCSFMSMDLGCMNAPAMNNNDGSNYYQPLISDCKISFSDGHRVGHGESMVHTVALGRPSKEYGLLKLDSNKKTVARLETLTGTGKEHLLAST